MFNLCEIIAEGKCFAISLYNNANKNCCVHISVGFCHSQNPNVVENVTIEIINSVVTEKRFCASHLNLM